MRLPWLLCVAFLAPVLSQASDSSAGAGSALSAGSGGYWRFSVFGDVEAERGSWTPYGWTSFSVDNYQRQFGLGGGTWKALDQDLSIKGGLGFNFGRIKDSGKAGRSIVLETGVERKLRPAVLGGEYRLTAGTIGGPSAASRLGQHLGDNAKGKRAARHPDPDVDSYTYNELSGYARFPIGSASLTPRLSVGIPSEGHTDVSESLTLSAPLNDALSLTAGLMFQQSSSSYVYGTIGFYYLF